MVVEDETIDDDDEDNPHINDVERHDGLVKCQFQVPDVVLYSHSHLAVPSCSLLLGLGARNAISENAAESLTLGEKVPSLFPFTRTSQETSNGPHEKCQHATTCAVSV